MSHTPAEDDLAATHQHSLWMCDLCYPNSNELGMISDSYSLIFHEGKYHILGGQGHGGEIIFTFPVDPWEDPDPEYKEILPKEIEEAASRWLNDLEKVREVFNLPPEEGWRFVNSLYAVGYTSGCPVAFVFDRCGKLRDAGRHIRGEFKEPIESNHWQYGIIQTNETLPAKIASKVSHCPTSKLFNIHELYYTDGEVSWTVEPEVSAESIAGLRWMLQNMLKAIDGPVFVEKDGKLEEINGT
jgi:hypothetical protein